MLLMGNLHKKSLMHLHDFIILNKKCRCGLNLGFVFNTKVGRRLLLFDIQKWIVLNSIVTEHFFCVMHQRSSCFEIGRECFLRISRKTLSLEVFFLPNIRLLPCNSTRRGFYNECFTGTQIFLKKFTLPGELWMTAFQMIKTLFIC